MGAGDSKPISISVDGWSLLEGKVGFWGDNNYILLDKNNGQTMKIKLEPRRNDNFQVTVSGSKDNFLVKTTMTGTLEMVCQFLQKRYGIHHKDQLVGDL